MNKCVICNKEIKNDSQFIKGKWYHNDCIENLNNIINKIQKELQMLKYRLNYEEDYYIEEYDIDKLLNLVENKGDE